MLTLSWRRVGSSSALALTLVVGLPALAQAQLFPNLFVQRKRADCANEPPFYGHVRHDYFGYYPTCWRRFPEGWGCPCPNPDLPNMAAELVRQPRDPKPAAPDDFDMPTGERDRLNPDLGPDAAPLRRPGNDPLTPPLPGNIRSPFDVDPNPNRPAVPGSGPRNQPLNPPATGPGRPATPTSPFEPVSPDTPRANAGARSVDSLPSLEAPRADRSGGASRRPSPPSADQEPSDPVLALPEMTPPSGSLPTTLPVVATPMPPSLPTNGSFIEPTNPPITDASAQPAATQAPRRPSLIGGLFGGQGLFRRR
jgi:hypothetical protein